MFEMYPGYQGVNFFTCQLEDSPHLLRVWTTFYHNQLATYWVAK